MIRVGSSRDRGLIVRDVISEEAGPNLSPSSPHRVFQDTEGTQRKWMRERGKLVTGKPGAGGGDRVEACHVVGQGILTLKERGGRGEKGRRWRREESPKEREKGE